MIQSTKPAFKSGMMAARPRPAGVRAPVSERPTVPSFASILFVSRRQASASRPPLYALKAPSMRSEAFCPRVIGVGSKRGNFLLSELIV